MMNTQEEKKSVWKGPEMDETTPDYRKDDAGIREEKCAGNAQVSGLGALFNIYYDVCSCMGCTQTTIG